MKERNNYVLLFWFLFETADLIAELLCKTIIQMQLQTYGLSCSGKKQQITFKLTEISFIVIFIITTIQK